MSWSLHTRSTVLDRLTSDPLDVLVVGAGTTGAGVALDAAARGYRVGVVERADVASGTSSRSSKLIHGGLRYLATGDLPMVWEGVRERELLRALAPHLVRPLGFVVPTPSFADVALLRAGLTLYDAMTLGRRTRPHRRLSPEQVLRAAPSLADGAVGGGVRYDDAQTDDARLALAVLQAARSHGTLAATRVSVTGIEPRRPGRGLADVELEDHLSGERLPVRARWVVGAGGVWADRIGDVPAGTHAPPLRPARGAHLVFARADLAVNQAVVLPSAGSDGRRVFLVPWGEQVYVGTTDVPEDDLSGPPAVTTEDATYLLDAVNTGFGTDLAIDDAIAAWAGWRPLVAGPEGAVTADLSRRHVVHEPAAGIVTVTGGKLTTYRRMAADVVDRIVEHDGLGLPCRTATIPLGATGRALEGLARARRAMHRVGGDPAVAGSLYHRHGDRAAEVVDLAAATNGLARLVPDLPYLEAEVRWAVRHEMAVSLDDVLSRRLRVAVRHAGAGGAAIERAADLMAEELHWDGAARTRQVADYRRAVATERGPVPLR